MCKCVRELTTLQKSQISTEVSLEQKFLARHNLLLDCKIQGVDLTLISGSFDDISDVQVLYHCNMTQYEKKGALQAFGPFLYEAAPLPSVVQPPNIIITPERR